MPEQKGKNLQQRREEWCLELLSNIEKCLTGDVKQTALDFAEYCKANEMLIRRGGNDYIKDFSYKGNSMARIVIRLKDGRLGKSIVYQENSCYIDVSFEVGNPEYENFVINEGLSEVVWKNVKFCEGCLSTCSPGRDLTVVGKTLHNVCGYKTSVFLRFINPDTESLRCIKKLMEFRKGLVSAGKG